jgi:stearoyl-CoA desaturase (delta-9 desaturase)
MAFYLLKLSSWFGLVHGLKTPPKHVLRNEHRLGSKVLDRVAEQLAGRFNAERIAGSIAANLHVQELLVLRAKLDRAQNRAGEILATLNFPSIPNRDDLLAEARAMFAKTRSLDDIVDRAQNLIYNAVGIHLQPI